MIDITKHEEPCFALLNKEGCAILKKKDCDKCGFYKPKGCGDWVRVDTKTRSWLIPPEEYEKEIIR